MKKNFKNINGHIIRKIISKEHGLNMPYVILKTGKVHRIMNPLDPIISLKFI